MIKFLDLQKINAQYQQELKQIASDVIDSGWYILGDRVKDFEKQLSQYIGVSHCVACANGLDALRLIIKAYKELKVFSEGDEIIVPANTYIATILAITDNNLIPVFVEPDNDNFNININQIENKISSKTKAIMIVHLYGQTCWNDTLLDIAQRYNLKIIEDNAQSIGAKVNNLDSIKHNLYTGALGDAAAFSFYPGKNLGALGDSGAVTTFDEKLAKIVRSLANYGSSKKYENCYQGLNSRMDEIQAAFLSIKLKYLENENNFRRQIANFYSDNIKNVNITLPYNPRDISHVWHLFVIRSDKRDQLSNYLQNSKVQTQIHYPIPPHKQQCYNCYSNQSLPITEKIHREVLSLPISPVLKEDEIFNVVELINKFK